MASRFLIGIDVNAAVTRVVSVEKKLNAEVAAFSFPTPAKTGTKEERFHYDSAAIGARIAQAYSAGVLKRAHFCIRIPASCVNALLVFLPVTSKKDANAPVSVARQNMIPATDSFHVFQSAYIADWVVRDVPKAFFFVTRVDRRDIDRILETVKPFNAHPQALVPADFTLPSLIASENWKKQEDIAFVDIGEATVNIVIGQNGVISFHRNIAFGLGDIFSDLAQKLDVPRNTIERLVMSEWGVPKVDFDLNNKVALSEEIMRQKYESNQGAGQVNMLEMRMHLQTHLERITQEVRRSLVYYKEQSGGRRVWRLYFCGMGAEVRNLVGSITSSVGGECRPLTQTDCARSIVGSVRFPAEHSFAAYADLLGLVLREDRGSAHSRSKMNFIPAELRIRRMSRVVDVWAFYALLGICVAAAAVFFTFLVKNQKIAGELRGIEEEFSAVQTRQSGLSTLSDSESQLKQRQNLMEHKVRTRNAYTDILLAVAQALPADVVLNNVELSGSTARISGIIRKDYETASRLLAQFTQNLTELKIFRSMDVPVLALERIEYTQGVDMPADRITKEALREFTITAQMSDPEGGMP